MPVNANETLKRVNVGVIPFEVTDLATASADLVEAARTRNPLTFRLSNAYCVASASSDPSYAALFSGTGRTYPDGMPVVWAMRSFAKHARPGRVRGPSLFMDVLDRGRTQNIKHFFLGTTDETLKLLEVEVHRRYPDVKVAGSYAPPFAPLNLEFFETCTDKVTAAGADIIWIAMGSPKQDFAAARLADSARLPCVGIGAAFDFLAGTAREAPRWMQNSGTEWMFRLATEPKRLWRRYFFGNLTFLRIVFKQHTSRLRQKKQETNWNQ